MTCFSYEHDEWLFLVADFYTFVVRFYIAKNFLESLHLCFEKIIFLRIFDESVIFFGLFSLVPFPLYGSFV